MKRIMAVFLILLAEAAWAQDALERGFASPPPECRPGAFLDWMGGMVGREGLTLDLEALKEAGVGGVMIMQLPDQLAGVVQWPFRDYPGKVECLSDEWFAMMNHAIGEADRLGLTVATLASPGWSHVGGPWIHPEQGLKVLGAGVTQVKGPSRFDGLLVRAAPAGEEKPTLPEWSRDREAWKRRKESWGDPYQDVAVVALPDPDAKTGAVPLERVIDLTGKMEGGGGLKWDVPEGTWHIVRLGAQTFLGPNYPAPVEAAGLESDRFDPAATRAALEPYIGRIAREAKAKGYRSFQGFDTDSYESGFQNFSADLPAEFRKRMGYDCVPWLPAWHDRKRTIGSPERTARFRRDMLQVVSDLWLERFYGEIRRFAEEHELRWMVEPYFKLTIDWRAVAARSHLPGAEFWVRDLRVDDIIRDLIGPGPDSAALYGHRVVWAEAFTARPDGSAWRNDPWLLKPYGDAAYCRGINHFMMHGYVHNPFGEAATPGLSMGFWGTQFNRRLTWWPWARAWHLYLARCQFLLRQGEPVADVLAYPPRTEHIPGPTLEAGPYKQVVLDDETLRKRLKVSAGRLEVRPGVTYAALALTAPRPMAPAGFTPEALQKIRQLAEDGATVIGDAPAAVSASLKGYPDCDREMARLITGIWGEGPRPKAGERKIGKGRVVWGQSVPEALSNVAGAPDCEFVPAVPGDPIRFDFAHRRTGEADTYFVANLGDAPLQGKLRLRARGKPELWDPVTGRMRLLPEFSNQHPMEIPVCFEPRQSFFIVLRSAKAPSVAERHAGGGGPSNFPDRKQVCEITGAWDVSFDPKWGGPASTRFEQLSDWTRSAMDGIRYYSGKAVYRKTFDLPDERPGITPGHPVYLDLGAVRNMARVRLNGQDLGIVWCAPWRVEITRAVKEKGNALEIEVVNTWVNRIIGDEQEPADAEWTAVDSRHGMGGYTTAARGMALKDLPDWLIEGKPRPSRGRYTFVNWQYYSKDAPLLPSGLLGPVRVMTE